MSYELSIENPDWGEIELKILTRDELENLPLLILKSSF
tara:strand:- start:173 stop:286 length:114 start_codon:yes stop_codon:yes gene_type:complete